MIQDSGTRREFETGAVRDMADGKGRMEIHKMTDNEIIKALDCFSGKEIYCKNCAYRDNSNMGICRRNAAKDTIDLINRQRAEIEDLKDKNEHLAVFLTEAKAEAIKEFAEKVRRYIDVGHLRPPTELCFSELDVVNIIDNLVKEMVGEG